MPFVWSPEASFHTFLVLYAWLQPHTGSSHSAGLFGRAWLLFWFWPLASGNLVRNITESPVCVFLGWRLDEPRATGAAMPVRIFIFLVTGGLKRSLAVNRMWVYIIRGGQIKKNLSHSVKKMTSYFPSPNRSCKLFSRSFCWGEESRLER